MARKSRKASKDTHMQALVPLKNLTAIYGRLSVEDNGYKSGDSIQNQISFLEEFARQNSGEFELVKVYIDNGTTGTNFDRKEWNHMIEDITSGKINCVIVKDFSRMGRNYVEVGDYLEKIFPFLGVRVIAVNEHFDSKKQAFQESMLMYSLTNIVNEYYAKDISKKISQTKRTMQENGEYASGVFPYGYKKSDKEKGKLVVDTESAHVVKKIFEWRTQGKGCLRIAGYLNELAIPSPGLYRYINGNQSFKRSSNAKWKAKHIAGILTNMMYLGHMVQGKTRASYFEQGGKIRFLPKEDWIIVENTHEPLITSEQFEIAARMAEESKRKHTAQMNVHADVPHVENPLRKKLYCGQCGSLMTRRSRVKNGIRKYSFFCSSPNMKLGIHCSNTHVHEIPLMEAIIKATDQQLKLMGRLENRWSLQVKNTDNLKKEMAQGSHVKRLEQEIAMVKRQKQEIYADMKEELLSRSDYEYEKRRLSGKQKGYEEEQERILQDNIAREEINNVFKEYRCSVMEISDGEIYPKLLDSLIEKAIVFSPERLEVRYNFADGLIRLVEENLERA